VGALRSASSPWVFVGAVTRSASADGCIDEHMDVWDLDGTHLASALQLRLDRMERSSTVSMGGRFGARLLDHGRRWNGDRLSVSTPAVSIARRRDAGPRQFDVARVKQV